MLSLHKPRHQPYEGRDQRKKELNSEAWEKETSDTVSLKNKKNVKAEKYYTNEGTN